MVFYRVFERSLSLSPSPLLSPLRHCTYPTVVLVLVCIECLHPSALLYSSRYHTWGVRRGANAFQSNLDIVLSRLSVRRRQQQLLMFRAHLKMRQAKREAYD